MFIENGVIIHRKFYLKKNYKIRLNSEIDKESFKHFTITVRFIDNYIECSTKFTELYGMIVVKKNFNK